MEIITTIFSLAGYFFLAILGMAIHFIKGKIKGTTDLDWHQFFTNNLDKTILATLTSAAAIYIAFEAQQLTGTTAILIGYSFDSVLNKWDKEIDVNK